MAAGKSERVGYPKLLLKYNEYNTFIEHIIKAYSRFGAKEIIAVVNTASEGSLRKHQVKLSANVKLTINKHPEWHRFYSLKLGAKSLTENHSVFVHNVDNPFVNYEVLDELIGSADKADYISPEFDKKGGHPFLISGKIIQDLKILNQIRCI